MSTVVVATQRDVLRLLSREHSTRDSLDSQRRRRKEEKKYDQENSFVTQRNSICLRNGLGLRRNCVGTGWTCTPDKGPPKHSCLTANCFWVWFGIKINIAVWSGFKSGVQIISLSLEEQSWWPTPFPLSIEREINNGSEQGGWLLDTGVCTSWSFKSETEHGGCLYKLPGINACAYKLQ